MRNVEPLHRENPLSTIRIEHDPPNDSHRCFMQGQQAFSAPNYRACFSPRLLRELRLSAQETIDGMAGEAATSETQDRNSTRSNASHSCATRMPSSVRKTPKPKSPPCP